MPVQRESALQRLQDTCNLFHLNYEGTYQHNHTETMADNPNISTDALEQLLLRLTEVQDMLPTGKYLV